MLEILDAHLAARPYVLGGRPAMADFGLWGQLYEAATDPTPGALMRASAPNVMAWVQRMTSPKAEGAFESWASLSAGLMPLLTEEVGRLFLPWSIGQRRGDREGREELFDDPRRRRPGRRSRRSTTPARCRRSAASTPPPRAPPGSTISWKKAGCLDALRGAAA